MIVYDLECRAGGHRFEGWFGSSDDFARQQERGLVNCPECGSQEVVKAVQAPHLGRKGNQLPDLPRVASRSAPVPAPAPAASTPVAAGPLPAEAVEVMRKLMAMQTEALSKSRHVGDSFAEEARAMHYGERDAETIHGQATIKDAKDLLEEGIAIMPLPFPVVPPEQAN